MNSAIFKTYQFYFSLMSLIVAGVFIFQDGVVAKIVAVLFFINCITNAVIAHQKVQKKSK
ncbi:hypothetical protein ACWOAH_06795 [Vagococcus vulneris]|uniref:Uncharacterized protein n=1 Tax=Vagococcus vulneris TaxID=1977869 RepID=A0A429ZY82_9ENTE|nr:hypothetical protein [Vagococcus vulneris]RST98912.1 hypothetical protein CBF37_05950 [Vagococcus vulneris]